MRLLLKNDDVIETFARFGQVSNNITNAVDEKEFDTVQSFVCIMYGEPRLKSVNDARVKAFYKKFKSGRKTNLLRCTNNFDSNAIPPCAKVLYQKILRTIFVARRWTSSTFTGHNDDPVQFGWIIEDDRYSFLWFEGDSRPTVDAVCLAEDVDANEEEDQDEELMYSDEDADQDDDSDDEAED